MDAPVLVWFRDDLRLSDNPALSAAAAHGPVVALYVLDEQSDGVRPLGGAARWWLHHSLRALREKLADRGVPLVLRRGAAGAVVPAVVRASGARAVYWNRRYGGPERAIDTDLKTRLRESGVPVESFAASLLFEPWTVRTGPGSPYSVFTPFWKACRALPAPRRPRDAPHSLTGGDEIEGDDLRTWRLLPTTPDWAGGLRETWRPGEDSAKSRLSAFLDEDLPAYDENRDTPSAQTSRLSPHLRWGELSPYQVWHRTLERHGDGAHASAAQTFLSEIGWREFCWHVLFHFPDLAQKNWRAEFDAFPWPRLKPAHLRAWQKGRTGVPLVDAGMRELWRTGWMHNRVRMVVGSFLTKNLLIDWRHGEQWFWDTLVDADAAANPFNWQWVAGSGADAAPYFRVFNPVLQADRFDRQGTYVATWAPEYGDHNAARPEPLVDLAESRRAALAAYEQVKAERYGRE